MSESPSAPANPASLGPAPRSCAEAESVAWPWRNREIAERDREATHASALRKKGILQGIIGLAIGGGLYSLGHPTLATVAACLATLTLVLAIVSPTGAFASLERRLAQLGKVVGAVVTWIVMLPIFLFFFVPFGLLFRRGTSDKMQRVLDPNAKTYWRRRDDALGGERHLTQF
jgi:hypothetical protein